MRVAVTGSSGKLGRAVVDDLLEHEWEVIALDRVPSPRPDVISAVVDLTDFGDAVERWYANVGLPAAFDSATGVLRYVDLALDVWANPDGSFVVLDQDEFEVVLAEYPQVAEAGQQGRDALLHLAELGELPRWPE